MYSIELNELCHTVHEDGPLSLRLTITICGVTPRPCPTVAAAPVPVYRKTLNPAVVLTLTVLVMLPLVLVTVVPLAFHCQPT